MSKAEKRVKMWWNIEGLFNTTRNNERIKYNRQLRHMQDVLFSIDNAKWGWHIVLTFSPESVKYWFKEVNDPGGALSDCFNKIKNQFPGCKNFWKYEEGDVNNQPHYHTLWDFENRTEKEDGWWCETCGWTEKFQGKYVPLVKGQNDRCDKCKAPIDRKEKWHKDWYVELNEITLKKLIFPKNWSQIDWKEYFKRARNWWWNQIKLSNRKIIIKTDFEILMHDYIIQKWGYQLDKKTSKNLKKRRRKGKNVPDTNLWGRFLINGHPLCRKITSYRDLVEYVRKDFFLLFEADFLSKTKKKFDYSRNCHKNENRFNKLEPTKEWVDVLQELGEFGVSQALEMMERTKIEFMSWWYQQGSNGDYIYYRTIKDIKRGASYQVTLAPRKNQQLRKSKKIDQGVK